jgi:hypothetical protein
MASNANTRTVKLSELSKYAKRAFKVKRPIMVWGPPGIGKSETFEQLRDSYIADGKKAKLIDCRLSLWDPTDLKGYPYYDPQANKMRFSAPDELPDAEMAKEYDIIILFLDELNGAAPATQAAAYQLILNRAIGKYKLPDNVVIAAAGNRETDKGVTYRMPKPLANRFMHYEVRVDFEDWLNWATSNGIHPDVVGYNTFAKGDLYNFDPASAERSFATPRTWTYVSDTMFDVDSGDEDFTMQESTDMVAASIGEGTALKFMAHRKVASQLPNPSDILSGIVTTLKTNEISAKYSLSTSMAYELKSEYDTIGKDIDQKQFADMLDNCLGFWLKNFDPEMIIMATRLVFVQYGVKAQLRKLKNWGEFMKSYGHLIKEA